MNKHRIFFVNKRRKQGSNNKKGNCWHPPKTVTLLPQTYDILILTLKKWQKLRLFLSQPFSTFVQVYYKDKIFYDGQSQPSFPLSRYCVCSYTSKPFSSSNGLSKHENIVYSPSFFFFFRKRYSIGNENVAFIDLQNHHHHRYQNRRNRRSPHRPQCPRNC